MADGERREMLVVEALLAYLDFEIVSQEDEEVHADLWDTMLEAVKRLRQEVLPL